MDIHQAKGEKALHTKDEEIRQIIKLIEQDMKERIDVKGQQLYNYVDTVQTRIDGKIKDLQMQIDLVVDRISDLEKIPDQVKYL